MGNGGLITISGFSCFVSWLSVIIKIIFHFIHIALFNDPMSLTELKTRKDNKHKAQQRTEAMVECEIDGVVTDKQTKQVQQH